MKNANKNIRFGKELAQTLDFMIKYYKTDIASCKNNKSRNINSKELAIIVQTRKDLITIPNYEFIRFDVSDCNNKAKNLMLSKLFYAQMNKYHDLRRRKAL
jgi:hypothetical protein